MSATMEAQSSPMEPATTTSSGGQAAASSSSTSNQQQQPLRLLVRMNSSSSSNSTTKVIMAPSTSNSVSTTTAAAATASANNKRHTLGYRLRRLIFPPFRPMRDASSTNVHSAKDVEAGYNKVRLVLLSSPNLFYQLCDCRIASSIIPRFIRHHPWSRRIVLVHILNRPHQAKSESEHATRSNKRTATIDRPKMCRPSYCNPFLRAAAPRTMTTAQLSSVQFVCWSRR